VTDVRFSPHALANLADREIERAEVERALAEPDAVVRGRAGRQVYMRRYHDAVLGQEMLLRVIVEAGVAEILVITANKTSQMDRYFPQGDAT
jgi:Domain of unknown function (DUF4258)